jgi:hypothetical protein
MRPSAPAGGTPPPGTGRWTAAPPSLRRAAPRCTPPAWQPAGWQSCSRHSGRPWRFCAMQRLLKLLAAAHMGDDQGAWARAGAGKALAVSLRSSASSTPFRPRAAGCGQTWCGPAASGWTSLLVGTLKRQGSMPRCQSLQVKAMSSTPATCGARTHKIGRCRPSSIVAVAVQQARRHRATALRSATPCSLVMAWPVRCPAVRHPHFGARHRLPLVQRGDPGHRRVFTAQLEVHAQVGDQGRGAHIHGAGVAVAFIQQRCAQLLRCNLHHMEARRAAECPPPRTGAGRCRRAWGKSSVLTPAWPASSDSMRDCTWSRCRCLCRAPWAAGP